MRKILTILLVGLMLVAALSFSVINAHNIQMNYYVGQLDIPLSLLVICSLISGAFIGAMMMFRTIVGLRLELAKSRRAVKVSDKELKQLKIQPSKESSF